jgi:hypothetical protein
MLPASGAALYALVRSELFSRQAKGVLNDAKNLASDLPDDLMAAVRQSAVNVTDAASSGPSQDRPSNARPSSTRPRTTARKKSPPRKPASR